MDNLEANIMDKSMRSVFVGNIPYEATEEKLKDIFGEVGQVLSFKLVFDRETGKPKGYGFCEYRDQETALSAMRNLNGYEIGGRNLRVDNACTEKSRMEMQNLLNQPPVENPYGEPIQAEKAPEAISKAVASLPPEQMFELMKQMKICIQNNPTEARQMLLQNPQLAYALLQAQVVMRILDPHTACQILYPANQVPPTLAPTEKVSTNHLPINSNFTGNSSQQQQQSSSISRSEFQPVPPPPPPQSQSQNLSNNQSTVFSGQDVDLRSLDPRSATTNDPRLSRMGDQDMRTLPGSLPNPLPPPLVENFPKVDTKIDSFNRDPREPRDPRDPRSTSNLSPFTPDLRQQQPQLPQQQQQRIDPRQKPIQQNQLPQPVRPPLTTTATTTTQLPPPLPLPQQSNLRPSSVGVTPNIGPAGASDQEKAALIMQVLQLSDEQIAMLPPEQRNSILVLKEQIAKSTHR